MSPSTATHNPLQTEHPSVFASQLTNNSIKLASAKKKKEKNTTR